MDLRLQARNLELDGETRDYITTKVNRLARHLPGITTATVEIASRNAKARDSRVVAQITLDIDGTMLRGEERGPNTRVALDSAIDVMDRRVARYKAKAYRTEQSKKAGKSVSPKTMDVPVEADPEGAVDEEEIGEAGGRVVRVKRFPLKPMTLDEAAFQMELLGHDFFLFLNSETSGYDLLYKRRDGAYGLIKPEPL